MMRRWIIILLVGAALFAWGWFYGPRARQERGTQKAEARLRELEPKLAADPRFALVGLRVTTHPRLTVYGEVADAAALNDVMALTATPPDHDYEFFFNVRINPPAASGPAGGAATQPVGRKSHAAQGNPDHGH
jgi:hypothetical protein